MYLLGVPKKKDSRILVSILGSSYLGKLLHILLHWFPKDSTYSYLSKGSNSQPRNLNPAGAKDKDSSLGFRVYPEGPCTQYLGTWDLGSSNYITGFG